MLKISWAETLALLNILSCFRFAYYHWEEKNLNYRVKKKDNTAKMYKAYFWLEEGSVGTRDI